MTTLPLESVYNWYRNLVANPKYRWWVIVGTLAYLFSPFDISPDFVPFIGQIDDALVVTLLATELAQVVRDRSAAFKQRKSNQEVPEVAVAVEVEAFEVM